MRQLTQTVSTFAAIVTITLLASMLLASRAEDVPGKNPPTAEEPAPVEVICYDDRDEIALKLFTAMIQAGPAMSDKELVNWAYRTTDLLKERGAKQ